MVFFTILELTAQGSVFVLKQTYHLGSYLIWGRQKTKEEILEEKLEKQIEREEKLLNRLEKLEDQAEAKQRREIKHTLLNGESSDLNGMSTLISDRRQSI